jgi:hypothetical protein
VVATKPRNYANARLSARGCRTFNRPAEGAGVLHLAEGGRCKPVFEALGVR